jgi:hypothetical protein
MQELTTEPYLVQLARWPREGKHILAHFDEESVVVYQAYRPAIGRFAAAHGYFGGEFSFTRMSWIKPNFLWMMYRCGWGTKADQEVVLAIWLRRAAFDAILAEAVPSTYYPEIYPDELVWKQAVAASSVRLQWYPDHDPSGQPLARRAIQLGLRSDILRNYAQEWILHLEDISAFVQEQRANATPSRYAHLLLPKESVYTVRDEKLARSLGIGSHYESAENMSD